MLDLYVYEKAGNPNRAREVGHRITLAFLSIVIAMTAIAEPASMRAIIARAAGPHGLLLLHWLLIAFAIGALIDVVANDFLRRGGVFKLLMDGRVNFYMLQAILNVAIVGVMVRHESWIWPAAINSVIAFSSMWIAVVDTVWRYVHPRKEKRASHEFGIQAPSGAAFRHVASGRNGGEHRHPGRDL